MSTSSAPHPTRTTVPGELGIWIFILGDMCLYGTLFGSFMVDRSKDKATFNASSAALHVGLGTANILLLLTASLLVVLAIRAAREQLVPRRASLLAAGAIVCSLGFVVNKAFEYADLLAAGHQPTDNTFFTYYFVLTGIHLTHLLAGTGCLIFIHRVARKPDLQAKDITALESAASFWHVVDLLWIVLFALLYLVR